MEGLLNGDLEPTERAVRTAISVRWGAADSNWLSMPVHLGFEDLALEVVSDKDARGRPILTHPRIQADSISNISSSTSPDFMLNVSLEHCRQP